MSWDDVDATASPQCNVRISKGVFGIPPAAGKKRIADPFWGRLYQELGARLVLFEFKNYNADEIGKTRRIKRVIT